MNRPDYHFFEGNGWPCCFDVGGLNARFNTCFRVWLKYQRILNDSRLTSLERNLACLKLGYGNYQQMATYMDETMANKLLQGLAWFYSCGDMERLSFITVSEKMRQTMLEDNDAVDFSMYWDFLHLWAAFKLAYQLDLYKVGNLHWWEFNALLLNLPEQNSLASLRKLRSLRRDEFMGKGTPEKAWGKIVLQQKLKSLPENDYGQCTL